MDLQQALELSVAHKNNTVTGLPGDDALGANINLVTAGKGIGKDNLILLHVHACLSLDLANGEQLLYPAILVAVIGQHGNNGGRVLHCNIGLGLEPYRFLPHNIRPGKIDPGIPVRFCHRVLVANDLDVVQQQR